LLFYWKVYGQWWWGGGCEPTRAKGILKIHSIFKELVKKIESETFNELRCRGPFFASKPEVPGSSIASFYANLCFGIETKFIGMRMNFFQDLTKNFGFEIMNLKLIVRSQKSVSFLLNI